MTKRHRLLSFLAVTVASALALTACGASNSSPKAASEDVADGDSAAVKAARAELARYSGTPGFTAPNKPFDVAKLKGRSIAVVAYDQTTPALVNVTAGIEQAAKAAGLTTSLFDAKHTPSMMTAGVRQAVTQRAGAIILNGVPANLVSAQLKEAAAAGIPVISAASNQPDAGRPGQGAGPNVYATSAQDMMLQGRLAANAAIVDKGGKVKAILMDAPGIDLSAPIMQGFAASLKKCADCEIVTKTDTQPQDWATGLGSQATSALSTHPDANAILPILGTMSLFVVPAVQRANAADRVTVYSTSGSDAATKTMKNGTLLAGVAGQSEYHLGWLSVNQAMRGMLRLEPGNPVVPTRFVTPALVKKVGTSQQAVYGTAYESGFKKLWGID